MKVGIAQIRMAPLDLAENYKRHVSHVTKARKHGLDALFFPELSLPGYVTSLHTSLDHQLQHRLLEKLRLLLGKSNLVVGVGCINKNGQHHHISMQVLSKSRIEQHDKLLLHKDESPYYLSGKAKSAALATLGIGVIICYEVTFDHYVENAAMGSNMLIASVAKSLGDVVRTRELLGAYARQWKIPTLLVNGTGESEGFRNTGLSACWHPDGTCVHSLDSKTEGMLVYDTDRQAAFTL